MSADVNLIRRAVLYMQARRDHSQQELHRKLRAKDFAEADIQAFFADSTQSDLLNDHRFTESYIRARRNKGYGPLRIQAELQARGISEEMIAEQLDISDNAWRQEAHRVWQKHCKGMARPQSTKDYKILAKQVRFLQYRGFTQEQIKHVLNNHEE